MKYFRKYFSLSSLLFLSLVFSQNEESTTDTVIIDGIKYAKVANEQYFENFDYNEGMWKLAPGYGFGVIKGTKFSSIPSGYAINVITPYGFNIGPFYYNVSFAFGVYESEYRQITTDEIGITVSDTLLPLKPFYIGIGGDINFFENLYTEGHIGKIESGFGFRGFLGFDTGNLGDALGNDLDVNIMIGSDFYISTNIAGSPSYWGTLSLRLIYSFHTLFGS